MGNLRTGYVGVVIGLKNRILVIVIQLRLLTIK